MEVFTRLPGETESDARKRLRIMRGEVLKTKEDRTLDELLKTERILNHIGTYGKQ